MKETLKRIKADLILSAVLCVVMGVVILFWPQKTIDLFCRVLASGLIIMGAVNLISYFTNRMAHPFSGILGLVVLLVGVWIFMKPESIVSLIPIVIGVILVIHSLQDLKLALEIRGNHYEKWWGMLIAAAIGLIFGVLCIVKAFGIVTFAVRLIGVALLYDGISDLWIITMAVRTAKAVAEEARAVDVEYKEVEEETDDEEDGSKG